VSWRRRFQLTASKATHDGEDGLAYFLAKLCPLQFESSIEESLDQPKPVDEHVDERRQRCNWPFAKPSHCGRKASSYACDGGRNKKDDQVLDQWNDRSFTPPKEEG
jgi:hypothetical protein